MFYLYKCNSIFLQFNSILQHKLMQDYCHVSTRILDKIQNLFYSFNQISILARAYKCVKL